MSVALGLSALSFKEPTHGPMRHFTEFAVEILVGPLQLFCFFLIVSLGGSTPCFISWSPTGSMGERNETRPVSSLE